VVPVLDRIGVEVVLPAWWLFHVSHHRSRAPELAIRAIPDPSLMSGPADRGDAGDLPDALARPAEPL
jgi:hypothetical protein